MDTASKIAEVNKVFMNCIRTNDQDGFVNLYTDDAVLLANNAPPLLGQVGAGRFFSVLQDKGIAEVRLTTIEIHSVGSDAWERGVSEARDRFGQIIGRGNYIVIWKKTPLGWKLHRDIMNNAPLD